MSEPVRRDHHLVSKGYQRNFAKGWRVSVLDSRTGAVLDPRRHVMENWAVRDFLSVVRPDGTIDDSLEHDIAKRETRFLNVIRDLRVDRPVTAEQKVAIDELASVHLIRSHAFARVHAVALQRVVEVRVPRLVDDPRLVAAFVRQYGRDPQPGELEAKVATATQEFMADPGLFSGTFRRMDPAVQGLLAERTIQLVGVVDDLPGFLLADNPVLHGIRAEGRFGFRDAVAVDEADTFVVPIGRRLLAFYTHDPLPAVHIRLKESLRWVNALLMCSAVGEVACHPDDAAECSDLIANLDRYMISGFDTITIA
jgi:hypothetical protein